MKLNVSVPTHSHVVYLFGKQMIPSIFTKFKQYSEVSNYSAGIIRNRSNDKAGLQVSSCECMIPMFLSLTFFLWFSGCPNMYQLIMHCRGFCAVT